MIALNDVKCHDRQNCSFYNFCTYFPELFSLQGCDSITPSLQQIASVMKILSNVRVARPANNVEEIDSIYFFFITKAALCYMDFLLPMSPGGREFGLSMLFV